MPAGIPLCPENLDEKVEARCGYTIMSKKTRTRRWKGGNEHE